MPEESQLRALIVDDEPPARELIQNLLAGEPDIEVVGAAGDGEAAVAAIVKQRPDLVFLDVQMPEMDGFDVLEALEPDRVPLVIFITAFDQYAIRAFEVQALDYLLKPIDERRFAGALRHARQRIGDNVERHIRDLLREVAARKEYPERLLVKLTGKAVVLSAAEIDWVEAEGNYIRIHAGKQSHFVRDTLVRFGSQLNPEQFRRVHRSAIVNVSRIREVQPWFHGDCRLTLADGTQLTLSRHYKSRYPDFLRP